VVISYTVSLLANAVARNNGSTTPGVSVPVARFGANAHTSRTGAQGQIVWTWRGPNAARGESPGPKLSIFCR
jgi:hypothetical protein